MIREMQLLDAIATMVEDPTTGEQRMIISSKCGSKFVTVIGAYPLPRVLTDLTCLCKLTNCSSVGWYGIILFDRRASYRS